MQILFSPHPLFSLSLLSNPVRDAVRRGTKAKDERKRVVMPSPSYPRLKHIIPVIKLISLHSYSLVPPTDQGVYCRPNNLLITHLRPLSLTDAIHLKTLHLRFRIFEWNSNLCPEKLSLPQPPPCLSPSLRHDWWKRAENSEMNIKSGRVFNKIWLNALIIPRCCRSLKRRN